MARELIPETEDQTTKTMKLGSGQSAMLSIKNFANIGASTVPIKKVNSAGAPESLPYNGSTLSLSSANGLLIIFGPATWSIEKPASPGSAFGVDIDDNESIENA